ncbi:GNAT family N-acetyltransferase [Jannaschia sp. S6380]|uniref:GNAT family N-acetyltransferase n=1 Tax=Jannaschia sp. S6380 TaxID=2926408 RepID=UPI001FF5A8DC|nr:GNAT family N-acetyltransferase [Jannaschia sp. S6380]MCK0168056.1 GNAT family N-acetyltransferase [Jannaschia sp. S6380]
MIPTLTTERLTLRAPKLADFDAFAAFGASDRSHFMGGPVHPANSWQKFCAVIGHWTLRGYGRWIVTEMGADQALGLVGLHHPLEWPEPEIAWTLYDGAEGKGYAHEAALAARAHAYDTLGWTTAISFVDPANTRSLALARRLGCRADGTFEHAVFGTMHIQRHPGPEETA